MNASASIYDTEGVRSALAAIDWQVVAKTTLEFADEEVPGATYLSEDGVVRGAETLGEVNGLLLASAGEADYSVGSWVATVSLEAYRAACKAFEDTGLYEE